MAPPFTTLLGTDTGQSSTNTTHQRPGMESSFVHFCKNNPLPPNPPFVSFVLLVCPVCREDDAVLLLGSFYQLPFLLPVLPLLCLWCSLPPWTAPHGHLTSPGLSNGGTWYCVFCWLFNNLPCSGFQTPFKSTRAVISATSSPFTPMANFTSFHTFHGFIQWCKTIWTFIKATASMQIKAYFALRTKVFAKARITVFYSASCTSVHIRGSVSIVP